MGAGEILSSVKCLLHKSQELSLDSQIEGENQTCWYVLKDPRPDDIIQVDVGGVLVDHLMSS